jgi:hypothetical protein
VQTQKPTGVGEKMADAIVAGLTKDWRSRFADTSHHNRLMRYTTNFVDRLGAALGSYVDLDVIAANQGRCTEIADAFINDYIKEKHGKITSISAQVRERRRALELIGVRVSDVLDRQIRILETEVWKRTHTKQVNDTAAKKQEQRETFAPLFDKIGPLVDNLIAPEFFAMIRHIAEQPPPSFPCYLVDEMRMITSKNKTSFERTGMVLKAAAYHYLASSTGIRGGHLCLATLDDFKLEPGEEGFFLSYQNRKNGMRLDVVRHCVTRVVPHTDPVQCAIVRLALFIAFLTRTTGFVLNPFLYTRECQNTDLKVADAAKKRSAALRGHKQITAMLEAFVIRLGVAQGMGKKKLHIYRDLCNNKLIEAGVSESDRESHIGWQDRVSRSTYSNRVAVAKNLETPFKLAGRADKNQPAHRMWDLLDDVPASLLPRNLSHPFLVYMCKVHVLALANGFGGQHYRQYFKGLLDHPDFIGFSQQVRAYCTMRGVKTSDARESLKRRIAFLEKELALEKRKRTRLDPVAEEKTVTEIHDKTELIEETERINQHAASLDFPQFCADQLVPLLCLVTKYSVNHNFGLLQSSATGKKLRAILILAAAWIRTGGGVARFKTNRAQNWVTWVKRWRTRVDPLMEVPMVDLIRYKEYINL